MRHLLLDTFEEMAQERIPNFLRLYLNPHVTQTCYCLGKMVRDTWYADSTGRFQTFLANGFAEAISGAVKLARFSADLHAQPKAGLIVGADHRLECFSSVAIGSRHVLEFIPDLHSVGYEELKSAARLGARLGQLVI